MKTPKTTTLHIPSILHAASHLKTKGILKSENNYTYLDIDDNYIHDLFPLLKDPQIKMPDYFGEKSVGAHITVIYPEENKEIGTEDLGKEHQFSIKSVASVEMPQKIYYVLLVESLSLLEIRRKHQLSDLLSFKGYFIGFHITIGVIPLPDENSYSNRIGKGKGSFNSPDEVDSFLRGERDKWE